MTTIITKQAKTILTPQKTGFLAQDPFPFTHALSAYTGCGFGCGSCGSYCYAQHLPAWRYARPAGAAWGSTVMVKENAPELLEDYLRKASPAHRQTLRIYMSSSTDPYQDAEREHRLTRRILEVFAQYPDLDLLVVRTRSPLAERDFGLMKEIPYLWLGVTVETDNQRIITKLGGGPSVTQRMKLVEKAAAMGINTAIGISPCLPHSSRFVEKLLATGAQRFVVDTFIGDGQDGARTAHSPVAPLLPDWKDETAAFSLYTLLLEAGATAGWSSEGCCSIPYRSEAARPAPPPPVMVARQEDLFSSAMDITDIVLTLGVPGTPPRSLPGFTYFWVKYVTGFLPQYHCAACLEGHWHTAIRSGVTIPSVHILSKHPADYVYLCGVANNEQWADNLHVPMRHVPGAAFETRTYNGIPIRVENAERLDIPWGDDAAFVGWPQSFRTCRNWLFAVDRYGLPADAQPSQPEFSRRRADRNRQGHERRT